MARVAQLVEHATENRSVGGSTPSPGTIFTLDPARGAVTRGRGLVVAIAVTVHLTIFATDLRLS
jgi:hypothetical protein